MPKTVKKKPVAKRKVRVKVVKPFVTPETHEVVLEVKSEEPPPQSIVVSSKRLWEWLKKHMEGM